MTYADQTASGRSLSYIEDYLVKQVLPFYGNTHTDDSHVGSKTTRLVHKAARYIKRCMGAGPGDARGLSDTPRHATGRSSQRSIGTPKMPGLPSANGIIRHVNMHTHGCPRLHVETDAQMYVRRGRCSHSILPVCPLTSPD